MRLLLILILAAASLLFTGCLEDASSLSIGYEKYTLPNGLEVILHKDTSDPIVAVAVQYHVGSNREERGKTGFAHLFEHMMFQESQHIGQDQFFKKIQEAGGTLNGGTGRDATSYYEVLPKNALEMALWMEADRMGYLLSTVTPEAFANQQGVVINEKKQRMDNQPYGYTWYAMNKLLYPEGHPYSWPVIGSVKDLMNATVEDIQKFHGKYYVPNNATLVVAGDFDRKQAKKWISKYFGEIKPAKSVKDPEPIPVSLDKQRRAYYECPFAKSPQLSMVFPAVPSFHEDSYALDYLSDLLSDGKNAPLYKVLVEEKKLTPGIGANNSGGEIAGAFLFSTRAFPTTSLGDVEDAIKEALKWFETEGFTAQDLKRLKARTETRFYNGLSSILSKSFRLAFYNEYAGSPDFIKDDLKRTLAVTEEDIWCVYNKYIKDKPYVLLNVIPKGKTELLAKNMDKLEIESDPVMDESILGQAGDGMTNITSISSSFDRSVEPEKGPDPLLNLPDVWQADLKNGIKVYGIEHTELPLVQFNITIRGGQLLDSTNKVGVAALMGALMNEGTKNKTPLELENAIKDLGASISVRSGRESVTMQASCLASKFDDVYKLAEEMLLEPRWDEKEFQRIKQQTLEGIKRSKANPGSISARKFSRLLYGPNHIFGYPSSGTEESVASITIDDLKEYYKKNISPTEAHIAVTGDISQDRAVQAFASLCDSWQKKTVRFPKYALPSDPKKAQLYFVDFPGAKQSQIRIGYLALPYTDPDYYPAFVMNFPLGGTFNSRLNSILREEKGYTYGARSRFSGTKIPGPFSASSAVMTSATEDSVKIFDNVLTKYHTGITDNDLATAKNALLKSNSRRFETLGALRGMLNTIAKYNLPFDYVKDHEKIVMAMTRDRMEQLAREYITPEKMVCLVVGDAATQLEPLKTIGLGDPIVLEND
jgi:zinc protease